MSALRWQGADTVDGRREQRMSPDGPPSLHNCLGYLESDSIVSRCLGDLGSGPVEHIPVVKTTL